MIRHPTPTTAHLVQTRSGVFSFVDRWHGSDRPDTSKPDFEQRQWSQRVSAAQPHTPQLKLPSTHGLPTLASSNGAGCDMPSSLPHDKVRSGTGLELSPAERKAQDGETAEKICVTPAEAARPYPAIQGVIFAGTRNRNRPDRSAS